MADIIGATTQAVKSVKTLTNMASATSLSGIGTSISDSIGNTVDSVTKGISNALKSISNGSIGDILSAITGGEAIVEMEMPSPNILHKYATHAAILGIGCLDADSFNYPGSSYMAGIMPPMICKSANGDPSNRILMVDGNKCDFFIDNLSIKAGCAFTESAGNTNTTNIEFTITEPYSMGMFIVAVQTAAYQQGYSNWNDANYLLTIDFKGNTENGQLASVPNGRKCIAFKFNNFNMKVTESGSVYNVIARIATSETLNDGVTHFKTDVTITGKTVQEVLQSGPHSLQQTVNAKYRELVSQGAAKLQDEIVILFPNTPSSTGNGAVVVASGKTEKKSSATKNPTLINDSNLFKKLGISRSSSSSQLVQNEGTCNALGKGTIGFDVTRSGNRPFPNDDAVWDDAKKIYIRSDVCSLPGTTDFKFSQGSDIVNAINQVMLTSSSAVTALHLDQITPQGMRPWWRIDTQVYHIASDVNMKITGTVPKLYVFRIVPYMVHASNFLPPNAPAPGLAELKKQAAKEYNYIYTGRNVDLMRFDIEINNAFFNPFATDVFRKTGDVTTAQQTASGMDDAASTTKSQNIPALIGGTPSTPGMQSTSVKFEKNLTSSDNKGGSRGDTEATRAAKLFHDAVINSMDMITITCEILGDPYYITSSGTGNYTALTTQYFNVGNDGAMSYQNGEIHFVVNFRTPTDIIQSTGLYDLKNTKLCQQFSGLYKLIRVTSDFKSGSFTQTLEANRIQGQDSKDTPADTAILTTDKQTNTNTGKPADTSK